MVHIYGVIISLAILASYLTAYLRRQKYNFSVNDLDSLVLWVVPLGIIGSRLYHVLDKWSYYQHNLGQIFAVWSGGLGIYGGVAGGVVGVCILTYGIRHTAYGNNEKTVNRIPYTVFSVLDFIIPSLAIGQAIGRWGNYFNHEVFGGPTNLPWKWYIPQNLRPEYWQQFSYFHPTFLYESLWCFLGFVILFLLELKFVGPAGARFTRTFLQNKKDRIKFAPSPTNFNPGYLTGFYAIWYGLGRFFLEFLRFDTAEIYGLKIAQIISLLLIILGVFLVKRAFEEKG